MIAMRSQLCLLLPLLALACKAPQKPSLDEQIDRAMQPYYALNQQKAELWYLGQQPQEFEFPGHGKVLVKKWQLSGWPGEEYVNARITFENNTDHVVSGAFVWLEIMDRDAEVTGSGVARMINPFGFSLFPGHTVTREIRAPTNGAHLDKENWQWTIACETLEDTNPGEEPVFITKRSPYNGPRPYGGYGGYGAYGAYAETVSSGYYSSTSYGRGFAFGGNASTYCPPSYPRAIPGRTFY